MVRTDDVAENVALAPLPLVVTPASQAAPSPGSRCPRPRPQAHPIAGGSAESEAHAAPSSNCLQTRTRPLPSHRRILIRSVRRERNTSTAPEKGPTRSTWAPAPPGGARPSGSSPASTAGSARRPAARSRRRRPERLQHRHQGVAVGARRDAQHRASQPHLDRRRRAGRRGHRPRCPVEGKWRVVPGALASVLPATRTPMPSGAAASLGPGCKPSLAQAGTGRRRKRSRDRGIARPHSRVRGHVAFRGCSRSRRRQRRVCGVRVRRPGACRRIEWVTALRDRRTHDTADVFKRCWLNPASPGGKVCQALLALGDDHHECRRRLKIAIPARRQHSSPAEVEHASLHGKTRDLRIGGRHERDVAGFGGGDLLRCEVQQLGSRRLRLTGVRRALDVARSARPCKMSAAWDAQVHKSQHRPSGAAMSISLPSSIARGTIAPAALDGCIAAAAPSSIMVWHAGRRGRHHGLDPHSPAPGNTLMYDGGWPPSALSMSHTSPEHSQSTRGTNQ